MLKISTITALLASAFLVTAHPGEEHHGPTALEKTEATKRSITASQCSQHMEARRRQRRAIQKRALHKRAIATSSLTTAELSGNSTIQNSTCVLAPEVTEGPYYINNELIRQDMRETQAGIDLILDVGVMDINTCEPVSNVYVEIWSCNATGHYSGFTSNNGASGGGGGMKKRQGMSSSTSDDFTFGRGGWPTNSAGVAELTTIFPGYYTGRTNHVHVMLHSNYSINDDGSLNSAAGTLMHVGQIFFEEELLTQVLATSTYANTTETRTLNADDSILHGAVGTAFAESSLISNSIEDGVLAYITIGVDSSASYSINTDATATAIDSAIASSARQAATGGAVLAAESGSTSVAGSTSPRSSGTSSSSTATGTASSSSSSPSSSSTSAASFGRQLGAGLLAVAGPAVGAMALL